MPAAPQRGIPLSGGTPDVGADHWATQPSARKARPQTQHNQMPVGMDIVAKNDFGVSLADGRVSSEDLDQGYCEYGDL